MRKIVIGSRESALAVAQTRILQEYIRENCPDISAEILTMKTTGDRILEKRLDEIGGKGLFVKELDLALAENRSQLSVHSLKDMPMETDEAFPILGFSRREDPRDVLVLPKGRTEPDPALPIGTSSLRRELQLKKLYPRIKTEMVRGNVVSRLKKLDEGGYGALVLAAAGLNRLGFSHRISRYFSCEEMLPAAGQGILAVQGRKGVDYSFLAGFFDAESRDAALAERAFVRALGGGCSSPAAAYAVCEGEELVLTGLYVREEPADWGAAPWETDSSCLQNKSAVIGIPAAAVKIDSLCLQNGSEGTGVTESSQALASGRSEFGDGGGPGFERTRASSGRPGDGGHTEYILETIRGKRADGERLGTELAERVRSWDRRFCSVRWDSGMDYTKTRESKSH